MPKKNDFWREFHDDILNNELNSSDADRPQGDIWQEYSRSRHPNVANFVDLDSIPESESPAPADPGDEDALMEAYGEDDSAVEEALTRREKRISEKRAARAARKKARHSRAEEPEEEPYEEEAEEGPVMPVGIDLPTFDEIMEEHKRQMALENGVTDEPTIARVVPEPEDREENSDTVSETEPEEAPEEAYAGGEDGFDEAEEDETEAENEAAGSDGGEEHEPRKPGHALVGKIREGAEKGVNALRMEEDDPEEEFRPVVRHKSRTTGIVGGLLYFIFVLCVSAALAAVLWLAASDALALGRSPGQAEVTIPDNATAEQMADALFDADLIRYKKLFVFYAGMSHAEDKVSGGTYVLDGSYDYRALVNGMTSAGGTRVEVSVTIPEGYTLAQIIDLLEENKVCSSDELWEAAANYDFEEEFDFLPSDKLGDKYRLEGYLFPDTYNFYVNDTASRVLGKFLSNFESKWPEEYSERASDRGLTMEQIIIVASMIEKEAGSDGERATISSVIFNRLNNPGARTGGYLQIDACLYYAAARSGQEVSTSMDDPYNTYMYKGLTPGPISNPGAASIKAALWPEDTSYFYYALSTEGTHKFFRNYDSFLNFLNSSEYIGNAE